MPPPDPQLCLVIQNNEQSFDFDDLAPLELSPSHYYTSKLVVPNLNYCSGGSRISLGGGGAPTPQWGALTYDFVKFSQKLHEIERIWAPRGGAPTL